MDYLYPPDFPSQSRARVKAEAIRASGDLEKAKQAARWASEVEAATRRYILRLFAVFAEEACKLGRLGLWTVERVDSESREFLRCATIHAPRRDKSGRQVGKLVDGFGFIEPQVQRDLEKSAEWRRYQDDLLEIAEMQASGTSLDPRPSTEGAAKPDLGSPVSGGRTELPALRTIPEPEVADDARSRAVRLEQFKTQHDATFADIRHSANVHPPDFQKWRTGELKAQSVMSQRIEDVLGGKRPLKRKPHKRRVE